MSLITKMYSRMRTRHKYDNNYPVCRILNITNSIQDIITS